MISAKGLPEDRLKGLEAGAIDYISKPFSLEELRLRLSACLKRICLKAEPLEQLTEAL